MLSRLDRAEIQRHVDAWLVFGDREQFTADDLRALLGELDAAAALARPRPPGRAVIGRVIIARADAAALPFPDASVDLIVTSPPYYGLRAYTDDGGQAYGGQIGSEATPAEYLAALWACTAEWARVLKPDGSMFVNLGDMYAGGGGYAPGAPCNQGKPRMNRSGRVRRPGVRAKSLVGMPWRYALGCTDQLGLILRAEIIWSKPNGLPESVTDRVRRAHEQVLHFTRSPRYYAAVDEIREPHTGSTHPQARRPPMQSGNGITHRISGTDSATLNPLGKLPGSVWDIPSQPLTVPARLGVDHFAAFPTELPRRLILGWSPHAAIVLDPFGGTGTTALVAAALGRTGITTDRSADYCRLAAWRTADPGEIARALHVPKPPEQTDGQASLFEEGTL